SVTVSGGDLSLPIDSLDKVGVHVAGSSIALHTSIDMESEFSMTGVLLDSAPGSFVDVSLHLDSGEAYSSTGIRLSGDTTGMVIQGNTLNLKGQGVVGIDAFACSGDPLVIDDNAITVADVEGGGPIGIVTACAGSVSRNTVKVLQNQGGGTGIA